MSADARQAEYVVEGWNVTGDSFVQDEEDYFHFVARTDGMIVSSGYNIAGPEVEAALLLHPDVKEAAVVGAPDEERGFIVEAHVVLRDGVQGGPDETALLQTHVKSVIAPFKYPRRVVYTKSLPKTESGKIQRFKLLS
jgi:2-aminobenzoate-CoA ligase